MATRFAPRRTFAKPARRVETRPPRAPLPPGAVVDAILRFHDEAADQGCGRTLLRLSAQRSRDPEVRAFLGEDAGRASEVSILWDTHEDEIVRVFGLQSYRLAS
jgi:hypothetical protein